MPPASLPSPKRYTLPITRPEGVETVTFEGQLLGWSDVDLTRHRGIYVQVYHTDRKICVHRYSWNREDPESHTPRPLFNVPETLGADGIFPPELVDSLSWHLSNPHGGDMRVVIERPYPMVRGHRLASLVARCTRAPCPYMAVLGWDTFDPTLTAGGVVHLLAPFHGGPLTIMDVLRRAYNAQALPRIFITPPQHWQALRIFQQTILQGEPMKVFPTDKGFAPSPLREPLDIDIRQAIAETAGEEPPRILVKARTYFCDNAEDAISRLRGPDGIMTEAAQTAWRRAQLVYPSLTR